MLGPRGGLTSRLGVLISHTRDHPASAVLSVGLFAKPSSSATEAVVDLLCLHSNEAEPSPGPHSPGASPGTRVWSPEQAPGADTRLASQEDFS